ncbi:hypothetical protein lerEdw1_006631 [Lerista edwardsae]|nr:hypothetical protein lerEdw1_006631 [Lerista edwardsae]
MLPTWWTARSWLLLLVMVCGGTASNMGKDFVQADGSDAERCAPWLELEQRGCLPSEIVDPRGKLQVLEDRPLSNSTQHQTITQLAPQRVALKLRPGEEQSFRVYFRRSEGYPVDLYYLMDLSHSMKDDLENIKRLGSDLLAALRDITTSVKIGMQAHSQECHWGCGNPKGLTGQRLCLLSWMRTSTATT